MTAKEARTRAENYNKPCDIEPLLHEINIKANMGMFHIIWYGGLNLVGIQKLENMGYIVEATFIGHDEFITYAKISW